MHMFNLNVFKYNLLVEGSMFLSIFMSVLAGYMADRVGF